jgi:hypothetical protein
VRLITQHTTRNTIEVPEALDVGERRPLGLSWSVVANSPGKLAAATAQILQRRGTVIVLVDKPRNSWGVAEAFKVEGITESMLVEMISVIFRGSSSTRWGRTSR